jgi:small nuclear ribonucleoprotein (snRNP)-like protein
MICFVRRVLVGIFMAFDRHMNLVLGETEEFRKIRTKKGSGLSEEREEKRALGLIILRGDSVVSLTIDGPPPPEDNEKALPGGPGIARIAAARGVPLPPLPMAAGAPVGLSGPVRGIGGPGIGIMQPPMQGIVSFFLLIVCSFIYSSLSSVALVTVQAAFLDLECLLCPVWFHQVCHVLQEWE